MLYVAFPTPRMPRLPFRDALAAFRDRATRRVVALLALLAGEPNIREVIAFPKAASGSEPMTGAPTSVPDEQLRELGIRAVVTTD